MLDSIITAPHIEKIREIVEVTSKAEVAARVNALDESGWDAMVEDLSKWATVSDDFDELSGGRFGISSNNKAYRLAIQNRVRTRLGYLKIGESGQTIRDYDNEGTVSVDVFGSW